MTAFVLQGHICDKKAWTVIFAADLIAYAIVGVSFSDATFLGTVFKRESHNMVFSGQFAGIVPLFNYVSCSA